MRKSIDFSIFRKKDILRPGHLLFKNASFCFLEFQANTEKIFLL